MRTHLLQAKVADKQYDLGKATKIFVFDDKLENIKTAFINSKTFTPIMLTVRDEAFYSKYAPSIITISKFGRYIQQNAPNLNKKIKEAVLNLSSDGVAEIEKYTKEIKKSAHLLHHGYEKLFLVLKQPEKNHLLILEFKDGYSKNEDLIISQGQVRVMYSEKEIDVRDGILVRLSDFKKLMTNYISKKSNSQKLGGEMKNVGSDIGLFDGYKFDFDYKKSFFFLGTNNAHVVLSNHDEWLNGLNIRFYLWSIKDDFWYLNRHYISISYDKDSAKYHAKLKSEKGFNCFPAHNFISCEVKISLDKSKLMFSINLSQESINHFKKYFQSKFSSNNKIIADRNLYFIINGIFCT